VNRLQLAGQRLAALFLLGVALFNYPLLSLAERRGEILGVPPLYAYLFFVWLLLIAAMAWAVERHGD